MTSVSKGTSLPSAATHAIGEASKKAGMVPECSFMAGDKQIFAVIVLGRIERSHKILAFVAYSSLAYSALACLRIGMLESASFQRVRKST